MADHFYDTSAISKHYHAETGSAKVDALLATPGGTNAISRLSVVEFHSVFAKKVRTGQITQSDFEKLTRQFRADVATKRLRVVRLLLATTSRPSASSAGSGWVRTYGHWTPFNWLWHSV